MVSFGQNLSVSFTGSGAAIFIDSVKATNLTTDQGTTGYKIICTETSESENRIEYLGSGSNNQNNNHNQQNNSSSTALKTSPTTYSLGYTEGDIILYRCMSSIYTTIVTDSPTSSKNYEVEFVDCTDPLDERSYSVVKIGYQTWMAENLAYLPYVSPFSAESSTEKLYYVMVYVQHRAGYIGSSIEEAKDLPCYKRTGVLYNWPAAITACPPGWRLPLDEDWKTLEMHLGMSSVAADSSGLRTSGDVAAKLKASEGYSEEHSNGGTNESGFTALAGGDRPVFDPITFVSGSTGAIFWSASGFSASQAWYRALGGLSGIRRNTVAKYYGYSVRCIKGARLPEVSTMNITEQTETSAQSGGIILSDGDDSLTSCGVCWSISPGPTTADNKTTYGPASGTFSSLLTGLTECTHYFARAYATNAAGTAYGDQKEFVTPEGTFNYDGRTYAFKTIGTQVWMTENLAYLPSVSPGLPGYGSVTDPFYYVQGYFGTNVNEAKSKSNYSTYGVLYNWEAANTACPVGWHLPSDAEWTALTDYLTINGYGYEGNGSDIGKSMAATSGWYSDGWAGNVGNDQASNNLSGFTALPGGYLIYDRSYGNLGSGAYFWSTSDDGSSEVWSRSLGYNGNGLGRGYFSSRSHGFSVRCLKGYAPEAHFTIYPPGGSTSTIFQFDASGSWDAETAKEDLVVRWDWNGDGTWDSDWDTTKIISHQYPYLGSYPVILEVKDGNDQLDSQTKTVIVYDGMLTDSRDGREYFYQIIGTQIWMIENLAWLPEVSLSSADSDTAKLYHVYGYRGRSIPEARESVNYKKYGVLYNWPAAMNGEPGSIANPSGVQGVCPAGWHLPGDAEWTVLTDYLGSAAGNKMKANSGWSIGNGDNSSGFTALPGGYRNLNGGFSYLGKNAWFWSASGDGPENALCRYLDGYFDGVVRETKSRGYGYSVRCLQD